MAKHSIEIKAKAFDDWLNGLSYPEIAKKYHISRSTIESWSHKEKWAEKKAKRLEKINNSVAVRFEKKILSGAELYFDIALQIGIICKKKLQTAIGKENPKISEIANDALKGVQIYKNIMPEAPEQLARQIAQELQKIKEINNADSF